MTEDDKQGASGIRSVKNAFSIIRYLNECGESVGVNRIAADLKINVSSCFRLLKTLVVEGVVVFDERTKAYAPAVGLIELVRGMLGRPEALALRSEIEELAQKYQTTAMVIFPVGEDRAIITDVVERQSPLRLKIDVGETFDSFVGAYGRCFAAASGLSKKALRDRFSQIVWEEPLSFETYYEQVQQAKIDGYAIDAGDHMTGVLKISAAVCGTDGQARLALSVLAFTAKFSKSECRQVGAELRDRADRIQRNAVMLGV
jgi:DNA-binding IclR family transcriptional regulator